MTCAVAAVRVSITSRAVARKTHSNNNMCIVHAHVYDHLTLQRIINNAYNAYYPTPFHPVAPRRTLLLLLSSTSFMCTLFWRYPTRVPICICVRVCELVIAIRTLHTRQFIIIITDRFYSSVFFPSSCYLVF